MPPVEPDPTRLVAVIGGTRGLGRAIAGELTAPGFDVVVTHRTDEPADMASVHCDVTDEESVDAAFTAIESRGRSPEIVVVNAGIAHRDLTMRMPTSTFTEVVDTNLRGAFFVARRALPAMVRARRGSIVFISSVSALTGTPGVAAYAASKAGLIGLARTMATEVGSRGVRVNVVAPGLLDNAAGIAPGTDEWIAATPARRVGTVAECAAVVRFIAVEASGITGAVIPVDGGYAMGIT